MAAIRGSEKPAMSVPSTTELTATMCAPIRTYTACKIRRSLSNAYRLSDFQCIPSLISPGKFADLRLSERIYACLLRALYLTIFIHRRSACTTRKCVSRSINLCTLGTTNAFVSFAWRVLIGWDGSVGINLILISSIFRSLTIVRS